MAGNPQKKSTGIVNAAIGALAVVLAILIVWMMNLVSGIQGTARIINYAGLVRGKTQRIVKLEISGQPQDGMIAVKPIICFASGSIVPTLTVSRRVFSS